MKERTSGYPWGHQDVLGGRHNVHRIFPSRASSASLPVRIEAATWADRWPGCVPVIWVGPWCGLPSGGTLVLESG